MDSKSVPPQVINFIFKKYASITFIAIIIILCFSPLLKAGFILYDDDILLTKIFFVKNIDANLFIHAFSFNNIIHYHPLVFISFAVENFLFGLNPFFFHLVNILLHMVNTILVLAFIRKITGSRNISLIVALLFAVHPMHVESVAWIAERKDLLYAFFYLLSLVIYIKYVKTHKQRLYYLSLIIFILSCLSKAMAVTLPFILFLIEYIMKINIRKQLTRKIPFMAVSVIFVIINIKVAYYNFEIMIFNTYERVILIFYSLLFYPFKMLLPFNLSAIYPYPDSYTAVLYAIPFLCLAFFFFIFMIKDKSKISRFGLWFYILSILPVLPILPFGISYVADRFVYLPIIGLFLVIIKSAELLWKKFKPGFFIPKPAVNVLISVIIVLLAVVSFIRCFAWKDTGTLMSDVVEKDNESYHAYYMLGSYYYEKNDFINAIASYSNAVKLRPGFACTYYNLGNVYIKAQKYYDAIENYNMAVNLNPLDKEAYNNLGLVYEYLDDYDNAVKYYSLSAGLGYEPAKEVLLKLNSKR